MNDDEIIKQTEAAAYLCRALGYCTLELTIAQRPTTENI